MTKRIMTMRMLKTSATTSQADCHHDDDDDNDGNGDEDDDDDPNNYEDIKRKNTFPKMV